LIPMQHHGDAALVVHDLPRGSLIVQLERMDRLAHNARDCGDGCGHKTKQRTSDDDDDILPTNKHTHTHNSLLREPIDSLLSLSRSLSMNGTHTHKHGDEERERVWRSPVNVASAAVRAFSRSPRHLSAQTACESFLSLLNTLPCLRKHRMHTPRELLEGAKSRSLLIKCLKHTTSLRKQLGSQGADGF
jgi:hypothetical protein